MSEHDRLMQQIVGQPIGTMSAGAPPRTTMLNAAEVLRLPGLSIGFGYGDPDRAAHQISQRWSDRRTILAIVSTAPLRTGHIPQTLRYHLVDTHVAASSPPVNLQVQAHVQRPGLRIERWLNVPNAVLPTLSRADARIIPPPAASPQAVEFRNRFEGLFGPAGISRVLTGYNTVLLYHPWIQGECLMRYVSTFSGPAGRSLALADSLPGGREGETDGSHTRLLRRLVDLAIPNRLAGVMLHEMMHFRQGTPPPVPGNASAVAVEPEGYGTQMFFADYCGDTNESERLADVIQARYGGTVETGRPEIAEFAHAQRDRVYLAWMLILNAANQRFPNARGAALFSGNPIPTARSDATVPNMVRELITYHDWGSRPSCSGLYQTLSDRQRRVELFEALLRTPGIQSRFAELIARNDPRLR
jgi:hypothetical protein